MPGTNKPNTVSIEIPTLENLSNRRSLIPLLFSLTIVFFFLNFLTVSCGNQKIASVSGINLVTGKELKDRDIINGREFTAEKIPPNKWAIITFALSIIGLAVFLLKDKNENKIGLFSGAAGAVSLLILQYSLNNDLDKKEMANIQTTFHLPYWGAVLSLLGASLLCYLRNKAGNTVSPIEGNPVVEEKTVLTVEEVKTVETPINKQTKNIDIFKWVRVHKLKFLFVLLIGAAGYAIYYFFLKPNPSADANALFSRHCDCIEEGNASTISVYKLFLEKIEAKVFLTREEARNKLQALLDSASLINYNCEVERNNKYNATKEKYIKDKGNLKIFEEAYQKAVNNGCNSKNNAELNAIGQKAEEKISLIIDPVSAGIHFSDATEFFSSFKNAILSQNKETISLYVSFPFKEQGSFLNQTEFSQNFVLSDELVKMITAAPSPLMIDENTFTIPGTGMGFSKHGDGSWRWDDITYGE